MERGFVEESFCAWLLAGWHILKFYTWGGQKPSLFSHGIGIIGRHVRLREELREPPRGYLFSVQFLTMGVSYGQVTKLA